MKGQTAYYAVAIIAVLAVAMVAIGGWKLPGTISSDRILLPLWGSYECVKSSNPVDYVSESVVAPQLGTVYERYYCNNLDIAVNGINIAGHLKSCGVTVTNPVSGGNWEYMICSATCTHYYKPSNIYGGQTNTIGLDFGEYIKIKFNGGLFGSETYPVRGQYYQKQLLYEDWSGYKDYASVPGCDIRAVYPYNEWSKLPNTAILSLNIDQVQQFVVRWDDFPIVGNYYKHPTYGTVICTPNHVLYKVNLNQVADTESETGVYTTLAGNQYIIPELNPISTNIECCPGETLTGFVCNNENKWVSVDQGDCCRGGICSALLCPGGGAEYCDLSNHKVSRYTCDSASGMCIDQLDMYAECCPPDQGCSGDEFCNADYVCEKKPSGLIACPRECCTEDTIDLRYYQEKHCDAGLICCPGGACKVSCDGGPVESDLMWLAVPILAVLLGLIGYFYRGEVAGIILGIIGGLIGYVIYWFMSLAWWAQFLIGLGLGGLGAIGIYVFGGLIMTIITVVVLAWIQE